MPASYGRPVSTSNRSTCRLADRIASGPRFVPPPYEVVASNGTGTRTTPASSSECGRPKTPEPGWAAAEGSNAMVDV